MKLVANRSTADGRRDARAFGAGAFAIAIVATAACSLIDTDGLTGESTDAAVVDATADSAPVTSSDAGLESATADGASGCVNLVVNPGFEDKDNCQPWFGASTNSLGTPSHQGAAACQSCSPDASAYHQFETRLLNHPFAPGESVHLTMWLRAVDNAYLAETITVSAQVVSVNAATKSVVLTLDYQRVDIDFTFIDGGGPSQTLYLNFYAAPGNPGRCLLVDDVSLCRTNDGG